MNEEQIKQIQEKGKKEESILFENNNTFNHIDLMDLKNSSILDKTPIGTNFRNDIELFNEKLQYQKNIDSNIVNNYFNQENNLKNIIGNKTINLPVNNINLLNNNHNYNENIINQYKNDILPNFPSFFNDSQETLNKINSSTKNGIIQINKGNNNVNSNIQLNNQNLINDFMKIKEPLLLNNNNINNAFNNYTQLNNRILFPEYNRLTLSPSLNTNLFNNNPFTLFGGDIVKSGAFNYNNGNESTIINNKLFENKSF